MAIRILIRSTLFIAVMALPGTSAVLHAQEVPSVTSVARRALAPDASQGVRVIASDARGLVLEIRPSMTFTALPGGALLPKVEGGTLADDARTGEPMALRLRIPVALPQATGNSFEVIAATYGPTIDGSLASAPTMVDDSLGVMHAEYRPRRSNAAAANERNGVAPVAELRYTGIARYVHAGLIVVAPYAYDASAHRIRPLESVRVRLTYAPASPVHGMRRRAEDSWRGAFINGAAAEGWDAAAMAPALARVRATAGAYGGARAAMRVEVREDGLYELRAADFAAGGIDLATVDPGRIAIYGGGGGPLSESDPAADKADLHQIPATVETSNGRVQRVLFYGAGPGQWRDGESGSIPRHALNPYTIVTRYIVAVDGAASRPFPPQPDPGPADGNATSAPDCAWIEQDVFNAMDLHRNGGSGRDWFFTQLDADPGRPAERTLTTPLPGIDRSVPVSYRVRVASSSEQPSTMTISEGGTPVTSVPLFGIDAEEVAIAAERTATVPASAIGGDDASHLTFGFAVMQSGSGFLDRLEIQYQRRLHADANRLTFRSLTGEGIVRYTADGFGGGTLLGLDVSDAANPMLLHGDVAGNTFGFNDRRTPAGLGRRYFITSTESARRVENVHAVTVADLRSRAVDAEMLVVTHHDLRAAAQRFADYRAEHGLHAIVVDVEDIYNEFGAGNADPTAIRNYVAWAFRHATSAPHYLVLFGDGCYDYRGIVVHAPQLVPPYESANGDSYSKVDSREYDDYFACVTDAPGTGVDALPDLAVGRIAVETEAEADAVIEKIRRYESAPNFGLWHAHATLVGDDSNPSSGGEGDFLSPLETLSRIIPSWMELKKIYLPAYSTQRGATEQKPGATLDLTEAIQHGTLITNWDGHGNANVWAHENVLRKEKLIPGLTNDSALTFVSAVTCNFGAFDDPQTITGAEMFLRQAHGGAVALLVTTRAVFVGDNELMMWEFFRQLFGGDVGGAVPVGDALLRAKLTRPGRLDNDQKYYVLGDPALRLHIPRDSVEITTINGQAPNMPGVQVKALSQVTISGIIRDRTGAARTDFDGTAIVSLYDAMRVIKLRPHDDVDNPATIDAVYPGGRLFRGPARVTQGRFTIVFPVPKDIAYDSTNARIHVYAYNSHTDAAGATANVRVFGTDTAPVTDHNGPAVKLFVDDRSFRSGDLVSRNPLLIVDLVDSSGINSSGSSIGHRIEAWIDDDARSVDLTDTYQTLPTDYGQGTAERRLTSLEPGEHKARVRAWDIYNNQSESTTYFRIGEDASELSVEDVVNYPNPMTRETDFLFRHNQTKPLAVSIAIYTTTGRKVRELDAPSVTDRFVRVHWDGTDADGQRVANGVYLYRLRVQVAGETEGRTYETIEKVAVVR